MSDTLNASDEVDTLVDAGVFTERMADRFRDAGFETVGDVAEADIPALTGVSYVRETRAKRIAGEIEEAGVETAPPSPDEETVASREAVLDAELGDKLRVEMVERTGYEHPFAVVDIEESAEWESAAGDNWETRRIRLSKKMSGDGEPHEECDLILAGDELRIDDPPVKYQTGLSDAPGWGVESVESVGSVSTTTLIQLQAREDEESLPEGDDTWRQYQRGEA